MSSGPLTLLRGPSLQRRRRVGGGPIARAVAGSAAVVATALVLVAPAVARERAAAGEDAASASMATNPRAAAKCKRKRRGARPRNRTRVEHGKRTRRHGRRRCRRRSPQPPQQQSPSAPAVPAPEAPQGKPPLWASSFESGNFTEWSAWGQSGETNWGHIAVVSPGTEGVPQRDGSRVARFETTAEDVSAGRYHAKLYKGFHADGRPPGDVSGTYEASFYFPPAYRVPPDTWVNLFQFKEGYDAGGGETSEPLWWVQLGGAAWSATNMGGPAAASTDHSPVAFINRWKNDWRRTARMMKVPLGRWVTLTAVVRQGQKIDFYLDGQWLDTAPASEYPVSPFRGATSREWVFGIGNYSTGVNGPLYADAVSYTAP